MDIRDSLLLIELDKGGERSAAPSAQLEEARRRFQEEPQFKNAWSRYQAVRALAWEAAPDLEERLVRQGLQAGRRHDVERRLARSTGSEEAARELLLAPPSVRRSGLPVWATFLLLLGALGLGYLAFSPPSKQATARPLPLGNEARAGGNEPLSFEFPASTPGEDGGALGQPPLGDDSRTENADTRLARRLLLEQLHRPDQEGAGKRPAAASSPRPTEVPSPPATHEPTVLALTVPSPAPTTHPTARPTAVPSPLPVPTRIPTTPPTKAPTAAPTKAPTALPTKQPTPHPTKAPTPLPAPPAPSMELEADEAPTVVPTPRPKVLGGPPASGTAKLAAPKRLEGMAVEAGFQLSGDKFPAEAVLQLPESGGVDLRLFDMRGRLVRRYADGEQAAGRWRYSLNPSDEQAHTLPRGTYYLRVITRWFSKVEALEQP
jgi:hypothetical protein